MEHIRNTKELAERIRGEIRERGPIPFARFMELALYCPGLGYYERRETQIGKRGDFYTSVTAGSLFGELLAFQFSEWLQGHEGSLQIVEAGAHNGELAADVLHWFQRFAPEQFVRLEYVVLEPSPERERWQRQLLTAFGDQVRWCRNWLAVPHPIQGVIFSNELLDAFPVHRLGWDGESWFEWGVDWNQAGFVWVRLSHKLPPEICPRVPPQLEPHLPGGYIMERCPAAENWWGEASEALGRGRLLAFDYGLTDEELWVPERTGGTLRAYREHRVSDRVLDDPGEQDITAHVQFSALRRRGERAGLRTECFSSQGEFLVGIAEKTWRPGARFGEWSADRRRAFRTWIHPEHLGRAFRVLVQERR